ncbi:MAG: PAS domain S-box protein [Candidatus Bathyarchaeia archaeon]
MDNKHIKVLLLEDNPGDARLIREELAEVRDALFDLECADRLSAGLERLAAGGIDVVLLDLSLPDSRRFDTFAKVHAQAPEVPIVVLTGLDDEELAVKAVRRGAQDYLVKGQVDSNLLVRAMRYAIERKWAEEALRESEEKYRSLFESANDALVYVDLTGRILDVNRKAEELAGRKREEILGKHFWKLGLVSPKNVPKLLDLLTRKARGKPTAGLELIITRKDGEKRFIEVNSTILRKNREPTGFLAVVRDITERKKMEEKLKEYAEQLEEKVEERTRELKEAQERLLRSERLAAIGELAAMVGHDLRNPLQAITNAVFVINNMGHIMSYLRGEASVPPSIQEWLSKELIQLREMVDVIDDSVRYANKVVSDLLDLAKDQEPNPQEIDLNSLIRDVLRTMKISRSVAVTAQLDETLPRCKVDPTQMKRVCFNLITNALQAMPEGGRLTIKSAEKGGIVEVQIMDTGVGIPRQNKEKVFDALFTTKAKGAGLGLAVCKKLVEGHGGSIRVESEVGKGSTFIVRLPIRQGGRR